MDEANRGHMPDTGGIGHPDFRDELIKEAEKMHIWRRTNKIR